MGVEIDADSPVSRSEPVSMVEGKAHSMLDRKVTIRLDYISGRRVFLTFFLACAVYAGAIIAAMFTGPPSLGRYASKQPKSSTCPPDKDDKKPEDCDEIKMMKDGGKWYDLILIHNSGNNDFDVGLVIENADSTKGGTYPVAISIQAVAEEVTEGGQGVADYKHGDIYNVVCKTGQQYCEQVPLLVAHNLDHKKYRLSVEWKKKPSEAIAGYSGDDTELNYDWSKETIVVFEAKSPKATYWRCCFNLGAFSILSLAFIFYMNRFKHLDYSNWNMEQRWMMIMLPIGLGYADPFTVMTLAHNWNIIHSIAQNFHVIFMCAILCWFAMLLESFSRVNSDGFEKSEHTRTSVCLKGLLFVSLCLSTSMYYTYDRIMTSTDWTPNSPSLSSTRALVGQWMCASLVVYGIWLGSMVMKATVNVRNMNANFRWVYFMTLVLVAVTCSYLFGRTNGWWAEDMWFEISAPAAHVLYLAAVSSFLVPAKEGEAHELLPTTEGDLGDQSRIIGQLDYSDRDDASEQFEAIEMKNTSDDQQDKQLKAAWAAIEGLSNDEDPDLVNAEKQVGKE